MLWRIKNNTSFFKKTFIFLSVVLLFSCFHKTEEDEKEYIEILLKNNDITLYENIRDAIQSLPKAILQNPGRTEEALSEILEKDKNFNYRVNTALLANQILENAGGRQAYHLTQNQIALVAGEIKANQIDIQTKNLHKKPTILEQYFTIENVNKSKEIFDWYDHNAEHIIIATIFSFGENKYKKVRAYELENIDLHDEVTPDILLQTHLLKSFYYFDVGCYNLSKKEADKYLLNLKKHRKQVLETYKGEIYEVNFKQNESELYKLLEYLGYFYRGLAYFSMDKRKEGRADFEKCEKISGRLYKNDEADWLIETVKHLKDKRDQKAKPYIKKFLKSDVFTFRDREYLHRTLNFIDEKLPSHAFREIKEKGIIRQVMFDYYEEFINNSKKFSQLKRHPTAKNIFELVNQIKFQYSRVHKHFEGKLKKNA